MNQIRPKNGLKIGFAKSCGDPEHQANHGDELGHLWGKTGGGRGRIHQNLNEHEVKYRFIILPCNVGNHAKQKRNSQ